MFSDLWRHAMFSRALVTMATRALTITRHLSAPRASSDSDAMSLGTVHRVILGYYAQWHRKRWRRLVFITHANVTRTSAKDCATKFEATNLIASSPRTLRMAKVGTGAETNQHEQADETQFIYKSCTGDVIIVSDQCLNVLPIHVLISKKQSIYFRSTFTHTRHPYLRPPTSVRPPAPSSRRRQQEATRNWCNTSSQRGGKAGHHE